MLDDAPATCAGPGARERLLRVVVPLVVAAVVGLTALAVTLRSGGIDGAARAAAEPRLGPATAPPRSLGAVAEATLPLVLTVEVDTDRGIRYGTAWPIDASGDVVTNEHVVQRGLAIRLVERSGTAHPAAVVGSDGVRDIAVLRALDRSLTSPLPIDTAPPATGDPVVVLASSRATGHGETTDEAVARLHDSITVDPEPDDPTQGQRRYDEMLVLEGAEVYQGNSGGPVLNRFGAVVAIVTATSATRPEAYAIPLGRVLDELHALAARPLASPSP